MPDGSEELPGTAAEPSPGVRDDGTRPAGAPSELVVHRSGGTAATAWRRRAVAVRSSLPQLVRNPVVVSASTVVAGLAVRLAVDVALRAVVGPSRPGTLDVSGEVVHHVHVHHHVHVLHHTTAPVVWRSLPPPPRP